MITHRTKMKFWRGCKKFGVDVFCKLILLIAFENNRLFDEFRISDTLPQNARIAQRACSPPSNDSNAKVKSAHFHYWRTRNT